MRTETITIPDVTGRCRWCQCTVRKPCLGGCAWVNPQRSLCSACVELDTIARTPTGRKYIARILQPLLEPIVRERGRRRSPGRTRARA